MFAYIICKLASIYNKAYVAIENNGVSFATLEYLWRELEYDNIIHIGGNPKTSIGIVSSANSKFEACLNFKEILENELRKIYIYDGRIIDEMERFEKHSRVGRMPTYAASSGHDDLMMASIWAFYVLKPDILENYYDIKQFVIDKLGSDTDERREWAKRIQDTFSAVNDFLPSTQAMNTDLLTLGLNINQNDDTVPTVTPATIDQGDTIQPEEAEDNIFTFKDGT